MVVRPDNVRAFKEAMMATGSVKQNLAPELRIPALQLKRDCLQGRNSARTLGIPRELSKG